jgi:hypothetical protein
MTQIRILPPAAKFLKKIKDKKLKAEYKKAIDKIIGDHKVGIEKTGDLTGIYGFDIHYNGINYELAYTVEVAE